MALLTEEQINGILDITNVCESNIVVSKLIQWNEKQTAQIEIDWSKVPRGAEEADLELHWLDRNGDKFAWEMFGHFERNTGDNK